MLLRMAIASSGGGMMRGRRPFIRFPGTCHWLPSTSPQRHAEHLVRHVAHRRRSACAAPWPACPRWRTGWRRATGISRHCAARMCSNWWPQAGRQPIEQPSGDVHLILEPPVVIDLGGLVQDRSGGAGTAACRYRGSAVQTGRMIGHQFGRLQRRCFASAEGREDVVLERCQPTPPGFALDSELHGGIRRGHRRNGIRNQRRD